VHVTAENTRRKQRGKPFPKGKSGNPGGRPPGARNKTTLAAEALLDGQAEKLTQKAIEKALGGDMLARRLCLDRIVPPGRERRIAFNLPPMATPGDAPKAMAAISAAVAAGELTAAETGQLATLVDTYIRAHEVCDLAGRVAALEDANR
jgi:hypothetical protein